MSVPGATDKVIPGLAGAPETLPRRGRHRGEHAAAALNFSGSRPTICAS